MSDEPVFRIEAIDEDVSYLVTLRRTDTDETVYAWSVVGNESFPLDTKLLPDGDYVLLDERFNVPLTLKIVNCEAAGDEVSNTVSRASTHGAHRSGVGDRCRALLRRARVRLRRRN